MNRLEGHIEHLEISGELTLVSFSVTGDIRIKAIVIETPKSAPYLGNKKQSSSPFKETEVVIGNNSDHKVSLQTGC